MNDSIKNKLHTLKSAIIMTEYDLSKYSNNDVMQDLEEDLQYFKKEYDTILDLMESV